MTQQRLDSLYYQGKPYSFFDVSDCKVLACKRCVGDLFGEDTSTACRRGVVASFAVMHGILVLGQVGERDGRLSEPTTRPASRPMSRPASAQKPRPPRHRPGTAVPFTGSLIAFRGGRPKTLGFGLDWHPDSLASLAGVEGAVELEFRGGELWGDRDLSGFVKAVSRFMWEMPGGLLSRRRAQRTLYSPELLVRTLRKAGCRDIPRGRYEEVTYVWRRGSSECVLCGSNVTSALT